MHIRSAGTDHAARRFAAGLAAAALAALGMLTVGQAQPAGAGTQAGTAQTGTAQTGTQTAATLAAAQAATSTSTCSCSGNFVTEKDAKVATVPAKGSIKAPAKPGKDGYSKKKTYQVHQSGSTVTVVRVADSHTVLTLSPVPANGYGFSPDENRFMTYPGGTQMRVYDLTQDNKLVYSTDGDIGSGFSPKGGYVQVNHAGTLSVVSLTDGHTALTLSPIPLGGYGFSPNDKSFIAYPGGTKARLYSLATGAEVYSSDDDASDAFSPKGGYLLIVRRTPGTQTTPGVPYLTLVDTATGKATDLHENGTTGWNSFEGFAPDDSTLLAVASDTTAVLYRLPGITPLWTQPANGGPGKAGAVSTYAYSPDGRYLVQKTDITEPGTIDQHMYVQIYDTTASAPIRAPIYTTDYGFVLPPDQKATGEVSGFGPAGHTFVDSYVNASGQSGVTLTLVNLRKPSTPIYTGTLLDGSAYSFSPCGGAFAVTRPNGGGGSVTVLYSAWSGSQLGPQVSSTSPTAKVSAADDDFVVTAGGTSKVVSNLDCAALKVSVTGVTTKVDGKDVFVGGNPATLVLTLDRPARDGGWVLDVSSDSPALPVPDADKKVTIPAGQTKLSIPLTSTPPQQDVTATLTVGVDPDFQRDQFPAGKKPTPPVTAPVTISADGIAGVQLDDDSVIGGTHGDTRGTVTLPIPAPQSGITVALASDSTTVAVPATVTVKSGATSAHFDVTTTAVDKPVTATITASDAAGSATGKLTVNPLPATTTLLTLVPSSGTASAGSPVTLVATVTGPGDEPPSGTVTFGDGGTTLGSVDLQPIYAQDSGPGRAQARFTTSAFTTGTHTLTAHYGGDDNGGASSTSASIDIVAVSLTWTGKGDGHSWSDPANWDKHAVPTAGDSLAITTTGPLTVHDDIVGLALDTLFLTGPITTDGDALTLTGGIVATGADAEVRDALTLPAGTHPLSSEHALVVSGTISGPGGVKITTSQYLDEDGNQTLGTVTLAAANTYTGTTQVGGTGQPGAAQVLADGALGAHGTGQGAELYGKLCLAGGITLAEPVTARGGEIDTLGGCQPAASGGGERVAATQPRTLPSADTGDDTGDGDGTAVVTAPIDDQGGLSLACAPAPVEAPRLAGGPGDGPVPTADDADLDVDGAISGPGGVTVCLGIVDFGGTAANSYRGGTSMRSSLQGDAERGGTLILDKPAGVTSLPGDLAGVAPFGDDDQRYGSLVLAADGQVAAGAHLAADTLYLGTHSASAASLDLRAIDTTVDGDTAGSVHVSGDATPGGLFVTDASDPAEGAVLTVVDNASATGLGDCPMDGQNLGGSAAIAFRVDCSSGDGNDLTLTAIWQTTASINADPAYGVVTGSPFTVTAAVSSAPAAPAATGQVQLQVYRFYDRNAPCGYNFYTWCPVGDPITAALHGGAATFSFADTSALQGTGLAFSYPGDSQHTPVTSPLMRYLAWDAPSADAGPAGAPSIGYTIPGTDEIQLGWSVPADTGGSPIVGYRITATPTDGAPVVADNNTYPTFIAREDFPLYPNYTLRGLTPGTTYSITVAAVTAAGVGAASKPVTATTDGVVTGPDVPAAPAGVMATAGDAPGTVDLSWTAPGDDGGATIDDYVITPYVGTNAQPAVTTPDASTSYAVTGLTGGTAYTFTVAAVNSAGTGPASDPSAEVTPGKPAPKVTPPGAPTGVQASPGSKPRQVTLSWTAPTDDGGASVDHYVITPYLGKTAQPAVATRDASATYTVTGLTGGAAYTFTVAAVNSAGAGPTSQPSAAVTPAKPLPGAPTGVHASAGPAQAHLTWTTPADTGGLAITGYRITPIARGKAGTPITTPDAGTSYTVAGLMPGTPYTFTVAAINSAGTGPDSAPTAAVTPGQPQQTTNVPGEPTGVQASVTERHGNGSSSYELIKVSWTPPADDGGTPITGYRVTGTAHYTYCDPYAGTACQTSTRVGSWRAGADATSVVAREAGITAKWLGNGWWQAPWPWNAGYVTFTVQAVNDVGTGLATPGSNRVDLAWDPPEPPGDWESNPCPLGGTPPLCAIYPPGDSGDPTNKTGDLSPGGSADVSGSGFAAGESVGGYLHSTPVYLGSAPADADGIVRLRITIPVDAPLGRHTLVLVGSTSHHEVDIPITLVAPHKTTKPPATTEPPASKNAAETPAGQQPAATEQQPAAEQPADTGDLAWTGAPAISLLAAAAALLLAGATALVVGRRRRRHDSRHQRVVG